VPPLLVRDSALHGLQPDVHIRLQKIQNFKLVKIEKNFTLENLVQVNKKIVFELMNVTEAIGSM
jgi:hypothetical protein